MEPLELEKVMRWEWEVSNLLGKLKSSAIAYRQICPQDSTLTIRVSPDNSISMEVSVDTPKINILGVADVV